MTCTDSMEWRGRDYLREGMKIIRVFPRRTSMTPIDDMAFVGNPPLDRPEADEVHVSCTFTWDKAYAKHLAAAWRQYYPNVKLGGPAFGDSVYGFTPGRYVKHGVTFTSRGCNNRCSFCLVPSREGRINPDPYFHDGYIIQDNNFLQCPLEHRQAVYSMLRRQSKAAVFRGGIEARLVTDAVVEELKSIRIKELFLSCDAPNRLKPLKKALDKLTWMPPDKRRCYVLIGKDETIKEAEERLKAVWFAGALPFAQLYQPADRWIRYSDKWRHLARTWSRPAAFKSLMKGNL